MLTRRLLLSLAASAALALPAAAQDRLSVIATTGMIADAARQVGGDLVAVTALMGPGVDPHAYRQTRSDIVATADADLVLEPRIGAASVDRKTFLFGIPSFNLPVPLAGPLPFPELALFKRDRQQGVVKLAMASYDAKTGKLHQSTEPVYSFSERTDWAALLFFSWQDNDLVPEPDAHGWVHQSTFD